MAESSIAIALPVSDASGHSPVQVKVDVEGLLKAAADAPPHQPQSQAVANFAPLAAPVVCIDVNRNFTAYGVKNGLVRILSRHSTTKALLRGHSGGVGAGSNSNSNSSGHQQPQQVTQIRWFGPNILATVGVSSSADSSSNKSSLVILWRVSEMQAQVTVHKMLELHVAGGQAAATVTRLVWHPFHQNQFWLLMDSASTSSTKTAVLVEPGRLPTTTKQGDDDGAPPFGVAQWPPKPTVVKFVQLPNVSDLQWSIQDPRYVITCNSSGVQLWDLNVANANAAKQAQQQPLVTIRDNSQAWSTVRWLPSYLSQSSSSSVSSTPQHTLTSCFVTACANGSFTIWSPFAGTATGAAATPLPHKLQVVTLPTMLAAPSPSSSSSSSAWLVDVVASPSSSFICMTSTRQGLVLQWHLQQQQQSSSLSVACDYMVPFAPKHETLAWVTATEAASDNGDNNANNNNGGAFDTKLYCFQPNGVKFLTLPSAQCQAPASGSPTTSSAYISVQRLATATTNSNNNVAVSGASSGTNASDDLEELEDYDCDDDDEEAVLDEDEEVDIDNAAVVGAIPTAATTGVANTIATPGVTVPGLANNVFSNWLGAMAAQNPPPKEATTTAASPVPPQAPEGLPPPPPTSFLSADDFVATPPESAAAVSSVPVAASVPPPPPAPQQQPAAATTKAAGASANSTKKKKKKQSQAAQPQQQPIVQILKRDGPPAQQTAVAVKTAEMPPSSSSSGDMINKDALVLEIRKVVQEEMRNSVVPAMERTVQEAVEAAMGTRVDEAMTKIAKQPISVDGKKVASAVSKSVQEPLEAAVSSGLRTVLIPTLESMTGQVLEKVSGSLDSASGSKKELSAISSQLSQMTALVTELTREVNSLRAGGGAGGNGNGHNNGHNHNVGHIQSGVLMPPPPHMAMPPHPAPPNPLQIARGQIVGLLQQRNYEAAFTKAVNSQSADMVVFCCLETDVHTVLGGVQPQLSQHIILCLMQQLATVLVTENPQIITLIDWLQEICLTLVPHDAVIRAHVPKVLTQLIKNIQQRLSRNEPELARPLGRLQQILRGMPIG